VLKRCAALLLSFALIALVPFIHSGASDSIYDLVISNGRIVDGTGNPWFYGSVAIKGDHIVEIGAVDAKRATRIIDAIGQIVAPGFIDVHTHVEGGLADSGVIEMGNGVPHPRGYSNNARVLGVYVREKKIIGLEDAIRKMTSLPATTFKLWDRGLIRKGMAADLVIFDEKRVGDRATFASPHQYADGFTYVFVNGKAVIENGEHTKATAGRALYGNNRE
jgi:N-acyl-D-aspartate/D-glutamate deacylase